MRGYVVSTHATQAQSSLEADAADRHTDLQAGHGRDATGCCHRLVREFRVVFDYHV